MRQRHAVLAVDHAGHDARVVVVHNGRKVPVALRSCGLKRAVAAAALLAQPQQHVVQRRGGGRRHAHLKAAVLLEPVSQNGLVLTGNRAAKRHHGREAAGPDVPRQVGHDELPRPAHAHHRQLLALAGGVEVHVPVHRGVAGVHGAVQDAVRVCGGAGGGHSHGVLVGCCVAQRLRPKRQPQLQPVFIRHKVFHRQEHGHSVRVQMQLVVAGVQPALGVVGHAQRVRQQQVFVGAERLAQHQRLHLGGGDHLLEHSNGRQVPFVRERLLKRCAPPFVVVRRVLAEQQAAAGRERLVRYAHRRGRVVLIDVEVHVNRVRRCAVPRHAQQIPAAVRGVNVKKRTGAVHGDAHAGAGNVGVQRDAHGKLHAFGGCGVRHHGALGVQGPQPHAHRQLRAGQVGAHGALQVRVQGPGMKKHPHRPPTAHGMHNARRVQHAEVVQLAVPRVWRLQPVSDPEMQRHMLDVGRHELAHQVVQADVGDKHAVGGADGEALPRVRQLSGDDDATVHAAPGATAFRGGEQLQFVHAVHRDGQHARVPRENLRAGQLRVGPRFTGGHKHVDAVAGRQLARRPRDVGVERGAVFGVKHVFWGAAALDERAGRAGDLHKHAVQVVVRVDGTQERHHPEQPRRADAPPVAHQLQAVVRVLRQGGGHRPHQRHGARDGVVFVEEA